MDNSSSNNVITTWHPNCPDALGITEYYNSGSTLTRITVKINVGCGYPFYEGTQAPTIPSNYYDLETIVRHELGHGIGFCHTDYGTSFLMSYATLSGSASVIGIGQDARDDAYFFYVNGGSISCL